MWLADEGKALKECTCGYWTHRDKCPECGRELTGDKLADDIFARIEAGENVDLNDLLRGEQWEQVKGR